jgi:hypothetical protein
MTLSAMLCSVETETCGASSPKTAVCKHVLVKCADKSNSPVSEAVSAGEVYGEEAKSARKGWWT